MKGGRRQGAGLWKGFKFKSTLEKEAARELVRRKITERLDPVIDAAIDNATGIKHLMYRDPTSGKFEMVTGDEDQIRAALKMGNAFWIYTKDPSAASFSELLNRALDKPAESHTIDMTVTVSHEIDARLAAGRLRAAKRLEQADVTETTIASGD